jgi:cell division septation protein DedD
MGSTRRNAVSASKEPGRGENQGIDPSSASDDTTAKTASVLSTRRRRQRLGQPSENRFSRPLAAALIVIVAGGAYLFWPRGSTVPLGIGEQFTVITADSLTPGEPRSGSVDIEAELQPLVAEKPENPAASSPATPAPAALEPEKPADDPGAPQPAQQVPGPPAPPARTPAPSAGEPVESETTTIQPRQTGGWAVQVGAYGSEVNAEAAASRLKDLGIDAQIRTISTSSGELIYRVWIGWFQSRDLALAYAKQERQRIGDAHPVHR